MAIDIIDPLFHVSTIWSDVYGQAFIYSLMQCSFLHFWVSRLDFDPHSCADEHPAPGGMRKTGRTELFRDVRSATKIQAPAIKMWHFCTFFPKEHSPPDHRQPHKHHGGLSLRELFVFLRETLQCSMLGQRSARWYLGAPRLYFSVTTFFFFFVSLSLFRSKPFFFFF